METVTIVDLSERVDIEHEHNFACGSVTLVFRDRGELAITCSEAALATLARAVDAAGRSLEGGEGDHLAEPVV